MKFLKSYSGAAVVMAAVIILSALLGSHRSLTAQRAKVEQAFCQGDESGYSIASDLSDCLDITANLLTVAGRYLDAGDLAELQGSRNELEASLDAKNHYYSISNAAGAYGRLAERAEAVMAKLDGCGLSEKDAGYVRDFRADLAARADTIARDSYNQKAEAFNDKVLGVFPANLLGRITFVREAEVFGP